MSFTYLLATDIGKVRLIISDKNAADYHFENEELQHFLTSEGSVNLAAAGALESWAAAYALNANTERIGDYSYGQTISKNMLEMASRLREGDAATPALSWAEPDLMGDTE